VGIPIGESGRLGPTQTGLGSGEGRATDLFGMVSAGTKKPPMLSRRERLPRSARAAKRTRTSRSPHHAPIGRRDRSCAGSRSSLPLNGQPSSARPTKGCFRRKDAIDARVGVLTGIDPEAAARFSRHRRQVMPLFGPCWERTTGPLKSRNQPFVAWRRDRSTYWLTPPRIASVASMTRMSLRGAPCRSAALRKSN
jgi:hypothetical protein